MIFASLFALFSIGFYVLTALTIIFIIWALEQNESSGWASFTLLIFGVLFYFAGGHDVIINLLYVIKANPGMLVVYAIGYILLGIGWSFFKWYQFLIQERDNYNERKKNSSILFIPQAAKNKAKLIAWMMYWPFSIIWFIINQPVKRFFNWIYNSISGLYDRMTNSVFSEITAEHKARDIETERSK